MGEWEGGWLGGKLLGSGGWVGESEWGEVGAMGGWERWEKSGIHGYPCISINIHGMPLKAVSIEMDIHRSP